MEYYKLFPDTGRGANTGECGSIPRMIDQGTSFNDCKRMCSEKSDCGYMSFTVGKSGNERGHCMGYSKNYTCTPDRAYYNNMSSYKKVPLKKIPDKKIPLKIISHEISCDKHRGPMTSMTTEKTTQIKYTC